MSFGADTLLPAPVVRQLSHPIGEGTFVAGLLAFGSVAAMYKEVVNTSALH